MGYESISKNGYQINIFEKKVAKIGSEFFWILVPPTASMRQIIVLYFQICDITHGSIAHDAGLTPCGPSYADSNRLTSWVITEVNGRPLSIFSKNDEAAHRLKAIGLDLTLVVQAKDFVKLLKTQLKNKKNWKYFVM